MSNNYLYYLENFYKLFYYENIYKFKDDLINYFEIFNYKINYYQDEQNPDNKHTNFIIDNFVEFNIYNDGTFKIIKFDDSIIYGIPIISKKLSDEYELLQDDIHDINKKLLEILKYANNSNKIINFIKQAFNNSKSNTEIMTRYGREVFRYKQGYCFEFNNNGFRVLYTKRIIGGFSINVFGEMVNPPHPQFDIGFNKP